MAIVKAKWGLFMGTVLFVSMVSAGLLAIFTKPVESSEPVVHPDAAQKARRVLITQETLDTMTALPGDIVPLPEVTVPKDNPMTPAKVELGKMLFFDPRLSGNDHWACSTCHNPSLGFSDGLARSRAFGDETELGRHAPTVLNIAYNTAQFWDGRASTMEAQAVGPIQADREMNSKPEELEKELNAIPEYKERFMKVFGEPVTMPNIGKAIATFERTLVTRDAPFDRYMRGDKNALNTQEKRGLILYISKAACSQCHNGANFTDNQFHNIGLPQVGPLKEDLGRYAVTKDEKDKKAFKTPTIRNVTLTPPYMHNGVFKTLDEVVDFYNKGGGEDPNKSAKIFKLNLTDKEKEDLVVFLKTLTGNLPIVSYPQLPQVATKSASGK
ncbi:MAG: cytochrome-c peroxidase [Nitrospira sp.]|nr:cytochrome-c peroxidase [Nitrospira sp.]